MIQEIIKVAVSPDPRMANRKKLADSVVEMAQFQVLVIDPPPAEDQTGLRGQVGITGELKGRLLDLYRIDGGLQKVFDGFPELPKEWDDVWNPILLRYRLSFAWTHIFHMLRFECDDGSRGSGEDRFRPFVAAMKSNRPLLTRSELAPSCLLSSQAVKQSSMVNHFS
jgi:hypothetical protein